MSEVYDNWEKLVEAIFKNEERRQLALCSSFSSYTSSDDLSSCPTLIDAPIVDLTSGPNHLLEPLPGVGKRGVAVRAARLFAAPAILRTLFLRTKQELQHPHKLRRFLFRELEIATDNFNNKNLLGRGGFGDVYKGRLEDGSLVAVKRCRREPNQYVEQQFQTEVELSCKTMHRNLRRLHGFSATRKERLLVYPLTVNGTVVSCLRERPASQPPLDWPTRKRIALGSARGLEFLHNRNPKVIHLDVNAANIFLDVDFEAVVGDFGLAKVIDRNDTHVTTSVCGTFGYIPPEYISTGQVSEKTDVFGYGVMLLELVTGQRAFDIARVFNDNGSALLLNWVRKFINGKKLERLIDPDLEGNYIKAEWERLIQLALICTQQSPVERPEMPEVVKMLQDEM